MIVVIDNRDSFTFNIVQELQRLGGPGAVRVVRGLEARVEDVLTPGTSGVLIGPGPGEPGTSGCSEAVVQARLEATGEAPPILGVCLGQQALATATGGRLRRASTLVHGSARDVEHDGQGLLKGLPNPIPMARYNSLVVDEESLAPCWKVTARTADGDIAGLRHLTLPLEGVQGHPESILTVDRGGRALLVSFLRRCRAEREG